MAELVVCLLLLQDLCNSTGQVSIGLDWINHTLKEEQLCCLVSSKGGSPCK